MYSYILADYAGWKEWNFFDGLALKNQVLVIGSKGKKEAENIFVKASILKVCKFFIPQGILVGPGVPMYNPGMAKSWPNFIISAYARFGLKSL